MTGDGSSGRGKDSYEGTAFGPYQLRELVNRRIMFDTYRAAGPAGAVFLRLVPADAWYSDQYGESKRVNLRPTFDRILEATRGSAAGVLPLLDSGEVDGRLFLAFPAAPGGNLHDWLRGDRSLKEAIAAGLALASTLQSLHRSLNSYLRLHPGNILFDANQQPLLSHPAEIRLSIDSFGPYEGPGLYGPKEDADRLTFEAPELMKVRAGIPDHRSDIYSLGQVVYRLATGVHPFDWRGDPAKAYTSSISEAPPFPSRLRPEISTELEDVILRALVKQPAGRFQTAAELRAALAQVPELR